MISPSKIIKYKFAILSQHVVTLSKENEHQDVIIFIGETLLPFTKEYSIANYLYDTIALLEILWSGKKPRKYPILYMWSI